MPLGAGRPSRTMAGSGWRLLFSLMAALSPLLDLAGQGGAELAGSGQLQQTVPDGIPPAPRGPGRSGP